MANTTPNEQELAALKEFQLNIQEIDLNLTILTRNLTTLCQYIGQKIIPLPLGPTQIPDGLPPAYSDWDTQSMSGSFALLNQHVLAFEDGKPVSPPTHFAVRCARGGLAANINTFCEISEALGAALESWRALWEKFKAISQNDEEFRAELWKLGDYVNWVSESFIRIREGIYAGDYSA